MNRTIISISIALLVVIAVVYGWHAYALKRFERAYAQYAQVAAAHDEAALIPMLPENPLRRDLNAVLADTLTGELSAETRLARADEGLALLVLSEGRIDAVGDLGEDVNDAILQMEGEESVALLNAAPEAAEVIELAHRRASIVSDIRGLSYRANHHTKEIFDRIIADSGALTAEHAAALERLLPDVEEQFNQRSNLSNELGALAAEVRTAFAAFGASW